MIRTGLISILLGLGIINAYPQDSIVSIPDTVFLHALIKKGVDTNGDSLISYAEAEKVDTLWLGGENLRDLTGISSFTNLEVLWISWSYLEELVLTGNTNLREMVFLRTRICNFDISNNTSLDSIWIEMYDPTGGGENLCDTINICVWILPFPPEGLNFAGDIPDGIVYNFTTECSDFFAPSVFAIDTLYQPDSIAITCSKFGIIYLVPNGTENDIETIRGATIDSVSALANTPVNIPLSGLDNGIYWLYARDSTGNISEPESFTIMGVGLKNYEFEHVRLYPNPTNNFITIVSITSDHCSIKVTSLNGQLLLNREMEGTTQQLDLSSFQEGVYFITIRSKDFVTTRKIIKL